MSYRDATYDGRLERDEILAVLNWESRRTAAYLGVLNRLVAGRLGLNPTDLDILGLFTVTGTVTSTRLAEFSSLGTGTVTLVLDAWATSQLCLIAQRSGPSSADCQDCCCVSSVATFTPCSG